MKLFIAFLLTVHISVLCGAQNADGVQVPSYFHYGEEPYRFSLSDSIDAPKKRIYVNARKWILNAFDSARIISLIEQRSKVVLVVACVTPFSVRRRYGNYASFYELCVAPVYFRISLVVGNGYYHIAADSFRHRGCFFRSVINGDGYYMPTGGTMDNKWPLDKDGMELAEWESIKTNVQLEIARRLNEFRDVMFKL